MIRLQKQYIGAGLALLLISMAFPLGFMLWTIFASKGDSIIPNIITGIMALADLGLRYYPVTALCMALGLAGLGVLFYSVMQKLGN